LPPRAVRRTRETITSARTWIEGSAAHLRADLATARREIGAAARSVGAGSVLCAVAATIGLLGALSLITGIVLVIGDQWLPSDWYALGALLVTGVTGIVAWTFARRGLAAFRVATGRSMIGDAGRAD
jgi:hypothetical protein